MILSKAYFLPFTYWRLNRMANNKWNQSWAGQVENLVSYYQKKKKKLVS